MKASEFFDLPPSLQRFAAFFPAGVPPWEWLRNLAAALDSLPPPEPRRDLPAGVQLEGRVYLHPSIRLPHTATLIGPAWIGAGTEIRPGAFVRGNVIVGERCVLGNASEFKHCLLLDRVQTPHYNYVGDSILGNGAHLGAGVICSNLRLDQGVISVRLPDGPVSTGLRKFGAVLGDQAEVGCNAVLNPGVLLGKRALVLPCLAFGGYLPPGHIARGRTAVETLPRRE